MLCPNDLTIQRSIHDQAIADSSEPQRLMCCLSDRATVFHYERNVACALNGGVSPSFRLCCLVTPFVDSVNHPGKPCSSEAISCSCRFSLLLSFKRVRSLLLPPILAMIRTRRQRCCALMQHWTCVQIYSRMIRVNTLLFTWT